MKRLLLMRHAEANWDGPSDHKRTLSERGTSAARLMGEAILDRGLCPQLIISSSAIRAFETAVLLINSACLNLNVLLNERIYDADPQTLLEIAAAFYDEFDCVMMVGHNPGFEGFIGLLTGLMQPMRAGSIAVINLRIAKWQDLAEGSGVLADLLHP